MLVRVSTDPGSVGIYYLIPIEIVDISGAPVLDTAGKCMYVVLMPIVCAN
jgi:hypothetical protein